MYVALVIALTLPDSTVRVCFSVVHKQASACFRLPPVIYMLW